jgi:hypothetical protein
MLSCITLKDTSFKLLKVKNVTEENIYKKCGYKTSTNFKKIYSWKLDDKCIELWSKEDTNIKKFNQHAILKNNSIKLNVNNKCIFFLRNKEQFINLEIDIFNKFFDLNETIEFSKDDTNNESNESNGSNESNENNENNESNENNDTNSSIDINKASELLTKLLHNNNSENEEKYEFDSELSYELYSYSEDEHDDTNCITSK